MRPVLLPTLLLSACVAACGGPSFFEANPATFVHLTRTVRPPVRTEPTVVLPIFDLTLVDPDQCAAFPDRLMAAFRDALSGQAVTVLNPISTNVYCQPFGRTTVLWGAGKEYPVRGEDFAFMLFRKRNCCVGY